MAIGYIIGGGGGGVVSSDVTAKKENVLTGTSTITLDSDDAVVNGTMPNIGKVTQTLGVNGTYTIPKGYHNGTGTVSQSITTKEAAIYYPSTSDQTIAANQYLTGAQTIKAISQQNLTAANIKKGVTVYVKNGNGNLYAVTGTWEGYVPATTDLYYRGTYGQYGALDFYVNNSDYASLDSGQISFHTGNLTARSLRFAFITPVTVNMSSYSKLYLEGSLAINVSGVNQYVASCNCYVDLLNSRPSTSSDALDKNNYYMRLASRSQSEHACSWGNYTFSWSKQNVTKYIRVMFSGVPTDAYLEASGAWYRMQLQS